MKVAYQIQTVNSVDYITGWYACAPDNPDAVELDPQLENVYKWLDSNGNPQYVRTADSIYLSPISLTAEQISLQTADISIADNTQTINDLIPQIIDHLIAGDSIPQNLKNSWTSARSMIVSAQSAISILKSSTVMPIN